MLLKSLKRDHKVIYDQQADTFTIYNRKTGNTIAVFDSNKKGLYLFTPDINVQRDGLTFYQDTRSDHLRNHDTDLLATVKENAGFYTAQQRKDAKRARELYHILGTPNVPTFKSMLQMSVIKNCPVTSDHIDIAEKIFRTDVATLKGKTTCKQTPKVLEDTVDVPEKLYRLNAELELCINAMCHVRQQMSVYYIHR